MRRVAALLLTATAVATAFLGCGGAPTPTAAPTAEPTPTETSTPTPEPELSAIVIGADSIELLAGDTTLETLAFSNDPAGFVEVSVVVTAPALGDVGLRTTEGYRVGDDCFAIASEEGAALNWSDATFCDIGVDFGTMHGEPGVDGYPNANTVGLIGEPAVSQIIAPSNLGIGRV